jgi:ABC-type transporter Mla maintaining outer membrane lipid asymmetry permease subunit MlaE
VRALVSIPKLVMVSLMRAIAPVATAVIIVVREGGG